MTRGQRQNIEPNLCQQKFSYGFRTDQKALIEKTLLLDTSGVNLILNEIIERDVSLRQSMWVSDG